METTLKSFVAATHINAKLVRSVVRQIGGWDSFKESAQDITNHGAAGGFAGFTYYDDTEAFTKRNKKTILGYATQLTNDIGQGVVEIDLIAGFSCLPLTACQVGEAIFNPRSEYRTEVFNALAWFALEEVARAYADFTHENE